MGEPITAKLFHEAEEVSDWRVVGEGACAFFRTGSFAESARLVRAISELPDHPEVDVRAGGVVVRLITTTAEHCGLTTRELELAARISELAGELGLSADPAAVQTVQVTIDALDIPAVLPFWRAVLGYAERPDSPEEDLVDPRGRGPSVWFQPMDAPRPQRNRVHFDVWVPPDRAEQRIAEALAAGGHLVDDEFAPSWWVLADAEGNEVCVATTRGRD